MPAKEQSNPSRLKQLWHWTQSHRRWACRDISCLMLLGVAKGQNVNAKDATQRHVSMMSCISLAPDPAFKSQDLVAQKCGLKSPVLSVNHVLCRKLLKSKSRIYQAKNFISEVWLQSRSMIPLWLSSVWNWHRNKLNFEHAVLTQIKLLSGPCLDHFGASRRFLQNSTIQSFKSSPSLGLFRTDEVLLQPSQKLDLLHLYTSRYYHASSCWNTTCHSKLSHPPCNLAFSLLCLGFSSHPKEQQVERNFSPSL